MHRALPDLRQVSRRGRASRAEMARRVLTGAVMNRHPSHQSRAFGRRVSPLLPAVDRQGPSSMPAAAFSFALRAACVIAVLLGGGVPAHAGGESAARGTIRGHVRLTGDIPGNPVIRMRRDPMCAKATAGKQVVQETVVANLKGDLANVFVKVVGSFPAGPPPTTIVTIDQHGCVYSPRVVGVQAGQPLQIRNSDDLLHNVHSSSTVKDNGFNIGQPMKGMTNQFRLKDEDGMVRVACDIHGWMTAWVGVVNHPYFAVSD